MRSESETQVEIIIIAASDRHRVALTTNVMNAMVDCKVAFHDVSPLSNERQD